MKRRARAMLLVGLLFALLLTPTARCEKAAVQGALDAAEAWLALIDEGKYARSWETAAGYFRRAVTKAQWRRSLKAIREPLGKVLSRELKTKQYTTSLPGAPDGQYVVIQYHTSFEKKSSAVETVTPMVDPDGNWRVSGYYIK